MRAADYGIAVFSTTHTIGVAATVRRMLAEFPAHERAERGAALIDVMTLAALITPQDAANAALTRKERKRNRGAARILARDGSGPALTAAQSLTLLVPAPALDDNTGHDTPKAGAVLCGQRLGPRRTCRRRLTNRPCPDHPDSPGSATIKARK